MNNNNQATVLGIDVGGANLKYAVVAADQDHQKAGMSESERFVMLSKSTPFPMWNESHRLANQIAHDLAEIKRDSVIACAITMTGELADCFFDRLTGVRHICDHVDQACNELDLPKPNYYCVDGVFRDRENHSGYEELLAASNWHALAKDVAETHCDDGLLLDIGSTTTDLIPIRHGKVATSATTDFDRLAEGSLVYIGGERTSAAMILDHLEYRGQNIVIMREHFATIADARLVLNLISESPHERNTPDGQPLTLQHSVNRLARLIGLSYQDLNLSEAKHLARQIHEAAKEKINEGLLKLTQEYGPTNRFVISGHNDDMLALPSSAELITLREFIDEDGARAAPAVAIARLLLRQHQSNGWAMEKSNPALQVKEPRS